ncbi:MAG: conjugative transfer signal peptidase TraF [Colwellia sp.]|nr:conjugative transfer signal peptidase TraF [Colwellia sp.]
MSLRLRTRTPLMILIGAAIAAGLVDASGLRLNLTPSLPLGVYRLTDDPVERGALVAVCLPVDIAADGRRRGYLPPGSCPGHAAPVLKRVGAVGGDVVTVDDGGVHVDGRWLQPPAPRRDRRGRPLTPWPPGVHEIADGELWLYTPETASWDSRYYGPVAVASVVGRVKATLTPWPPLPASPPNPPGEGEPPPTQKAAQRAGAPSPGRGMGGLGEGRGEGSGGHQS